MALDNLSDWQSVLWTIAATLLVLGLMYGCLWGLRFVGARQRVQRAASRLNLDSSIRLGKDQQLHLVRFEQELLLLGSSPAGLVLLSRAPVVPADAPAAQPDLEQFAQVLGSAGEGSHDA
jgi:flagellar biogenesis protein FliO